MIEVNAETDFVAKNATFKEFVRNILKVIVVPGRIVNIVVK